MLKGTLEMRLQPLNHHSGGTFATKHTLNLICGLLFINDATQKLVSGSRPESLLMSFS